MHKNVICDNKNKFTMHRKVFSDNKNILILHEKVFHSDKKKVVFHKKMFCEQNIFLNGRLHKMNIGKGFQIQKFPHLRHIVSFPYLKHIFQIFS